MAENNIEDQETSIESLERISRWIDDFPNTSRSSIQYDIDEVIQKLKEEAKTPDCKEAYRLVDLRRAIETRDKDDAVDHDELFESITLGMKISYNIIA